MISCIRLIRRLGSRNAVVRIFGVIIKSNRSNRTGWNDRIC